MPEQQAPKAIKMPKFIRNIITAPIPAELIKEREGGGKKMLSYISGSSVIDLLNASFGYMWDWEVTNQWVQDGFPFFNIYSKAPEEDKVTYLGKRGAWEEQAPVVHVSGRLSVIFLDESGKERTITKEGFGSKSVLGKQNDQESIFKAASTDALKKAASLLGIGAELYRDEDEQSYFDILTYEDPWTEEAMETYKEDRDYISSVMEKYELSVEDMDAYVYEFSEETIAELSQIVPENITGFANFLKAKIASSQAEVAEPAPPAPAEKKKIPLTPKSS